MIIYVDVLFIINLYVTYFELLAVSAFTHRRIKTARMIFAASLGGAAAFTIFLPQDNVPLTAAIKLFSCVLVTLAAFGFKNLKAFLKDILWVLSVNFIFAGVMLGISLFAAPLKMIYSNGAVYFNIDFLTLVLCTAAAYFLIRAVRYLLDKNGRADGSYKVFIEKNGRSVTLDALSDTGNGLVDWFSGLPVIICRKNACENISPCEISDEKLPEYVNGVRILPFNTVSSGGFVYAFKADNIVISDIKSCKEYRVNALIGISPNSLQEYDAIFNPKILV